MKNSKVTIFLLLILILGSIVLGSGCTSSSNSNNSGAVESRAVKNGDTIQVDYTGKLENGTIFDTSREDIAKQAGIYVSSRVYSPLIFVVGSGQMIKGFDNGVIGMKVGEEKTISIPPEQAYGEYDKAKVQAIPLKSLNMTIAPKVGQILGDSYGNPYRVIAINDTYVTLDGNNALAGKTLIFDIKLISVK
jgi:peptidylprolyl isomerase